MKYSEIVKKYFKGIAYEQNTNLILCKVPVEKLTETCLHFYNTHNLPLKTIKAVDERKENGAFKIFYIFGIPGEEYFPAVVINLKDTLEFPSLTKEIHQAAGYESEISTFFGLTPVGHPNLQPFILHEDWPKNIFPLRKDFDFETRPARTNAKYVFQEIEGEGIYEIPVGPVHAGIIEPGHFRFSVAGEEIVNLEPKLGYTHKGSEKLFEVLSLPDKVKLSERISGDSSFSHALAFCQAVEKIGGMQISGRAKYIRVIFAELERIANHLNDIGFILNDTAYSFGGSQGPRLKEQIMQLNGKISGDRFFRGCAAIGGVTTDISEDIQTLIKKELNAVKKDFSELVAIAEDSETVMNRLKKTGVVKTQTVIDLGVVGVAARASGIETDARIEYPYAAYSELVFKAALQQTGDVFARYRIRIEEVFSSISLIMQALEKFGKKEEILVKSQKPLQKNAYAVSVVEGWRGDIVYFISTDSEGNIQRVGVREASFLNWTAVPFAVLANIVPDFPLINKSFNLSYSGFDR